MERGLRDLEEEIQMLKSNGALSTEEREEEMKQMEVYRSHSKFMKNKVMVWDTWFLKGEGGWKTDMYSCLFSDDDGPHTPLSGFKEEYLKHNSFRQNFPSINVRITDVWIFQISLKITCVRLGVYYHGLAPHVCQCFWGKQNYIQMSFSPCMKRHILLWNSLSQNTKRLNPSLFFPPWNDLNKIASSLQNTVP